MNTLAARGIAGILEDASIIMRPTAPLHRNVELEELGATGLVPGLRRRGRDHGTDDVRGLRIFRHGDVVERRPRHVGLGVTISSPPFARFFCADILGSRIRTDVVAPAPSWVFASAPVILSGAAAESKDQTQVLWPFECGLTGETKARALSLSLATSIICLCAPVADPSTSSG